MIPVFHHEVWQTLYAYYAQASLPHAILLRGIPGIGKRIIATALAQLVLCHQVTGNYACGTCPGCKLFLANTHPDYYHIVPIEPSNIINIEQIRAVNAELSCSAHQGTYRCISYYPVSALNTYASNALLKTLEEPPPHTLIIIIDDGTKPVLDTIISRCQIIRCGVPDRALAQAWLIAQQDAETLQQHDEQYWRMLLTATHGAPYLALAWHRKGLGQAYQQLWQDLLSLHKPSVDIIAMAERFSKHPLPWVLSTMLDLLLALINSKYQIDSNIKQLLHPGNHFKLSKLLDLLTVLQASAKDSQSNLNQRLTTELLLIKWAQTLDSLT